MKENGEVVLDMEEVRCSGLMVHNMREIGWMVKPVAKANLIMLMEILMKEGGQEIEPMDLDVILM